MGLRFRKSIKLLPGVRLNVGLKSASISLGGRGVTYNLGSKGSRVTVGIPGSGLSYSTSVPHQNPVALLSNAVPPKRKFSLTPIVLIAFAMGILYVLVFSATRTPVTGTPANIAIPIQADLTGSISQSDLAINAVVDGAIPLPKPRPKSRSEFLGPPLQIIPQQ